jgi:putative FmdB family regulatory protein
LPVYEYRCPQGHLFDRLVKHGASAMAQCPACAFEGNTGSIGMRILSPTKTTFKFHDRKAIKS